MKNFCYLLLSFVLGCGSVKDTKENNSEEEAVETAHHPFSLSKVFDAHGGFDRWSSLRQLSYSKEDERTVTDLKNRKILISNPERNIGFDGEDVWVTPDSVDASRARFYHNLYFYFYAMPFVLGDPGIFYEDLEPTEIMGKTLGRIKISYNDGIGDSPKDNYIILYDPETYQMQWLMYTVTYRSGEVSEKYSLIKYDQWDRFEDVLLPTTIQWYTFEDGEVGDMRSEVQFEDISLSYEQPNQALFEQPENAQIAPLKNSE